MDRQAQQVPGTVVKEPLEEDKGPDPMEHIRQRLRELAKIPGHALSDVPSETDGW